MKPTHKGDKNFGVRRNTIPSDIGCCLFCGVTWRALRHGGVPVRAHARSTGTRTSASSCVTAAAAAGVAAHSRVRSLTGSAAGVGRARDGLRAVQRWLGCAVEVARRSSLLRRNQTRQSMISRRRRSCRAERRAGSQQVLTQRRVRRRQRDLASAKSGQRSTTHTVWLQTSASARVTRKCTE